MSKKIKITESQLKSIMSLKINEEHDSDINELISMPPATASGHEDAMKVVETIKEKHADMLSNGNVDDYLNSFIETLKNELGKTDSPSEEEEGMNMENSPEPPSEEESMSNQVYESIKNNFKRFL